MDVNLPSHESNHNPLLPRLGRDVTIIRRCFGTIRDFLQNLPTRYPWSVIIVAGLLAALGGHIYFFHLEIQSDRKQLINQELRTNRFYQEYRKEFGDDEVLVLAACAGDTGPADSLLRVPTQAQRSELKHVASYWADKLRKRPDLFPRVIERIEWSQEASLALLYLPLETVQTLAKTISEHMSEIEEVSRSPSLETIFKTINRNLKSTDRDVTRISQKQLSFAAERLENYLEWLREEFESDALNGVQKERKMDGAISFGRYDPDGFIFTDDGTVLTAFATIKGNPGKHNRFAEAMEYAESALRAALAQLPIGSEIQAGLAGMPALEHEELKTTQRDFARSAFVAFVLVTVLLMLGFRSILRPALAAMCLGIAIGITFGFVWLTIGHLNILALIFTVILVALGIDFAIYFLTHYERALATTGSPKTAIMKTHRSIGPALWMGGITTGVAFLSAYFTEFVGLSELGVIAGGGLLICLTCMILVYPAMLYLLDTHRPQNLKTPRNRSFSRFVLVRITSLFLNTPQKTKILIFSFLFVGIGYLCGQYSFDTNLLNLQAINGRASYWQKMLIASDDRSLSAVGIYKDRAALERAQLSFSAIPQIVRATESLFPVHETLKREVLASLCRRLANLSVEPPRPASLFGLKRELWNFRQTIRKYRQANSEARTALAPLENAANSLYRFLSKLPGDQFAAKTNRIQITIQKELAAIVAQLQRWSCPPDVSLNRIPVVLKERFLGNNGSLALLIYPAKNSWQKNNLEEFVAVARRIEPNIGGELVSLYENGRSLIRSFLHATAYSLAAILVLLLFWSRSVRCTLLSLLPLVVATGLLLGIMKGLPHSITWNFANFFALPILIGIGVDGGIHLVAAWRENDLQTFHGAVKAVLFSTMTTMIGFGILATSDHLGIGSFGLILFFGIGICSLASLTLLPAALKLFLKRETPDV